MASITAALARRAERELYDGHYPQAIELLTRIRLLEPKNGENLLNLAYALNQNGDYIGALCYCYAMLGMDTDAKRDMLYFITAEAFGGAGCIEGCAQMLENCLKINPNGSASRDAQAFLEDLRGRYEIGEYHVGSDEVSMGTGNAITEAPFLNAETIEFIQDACVLGEQGQPEQILSRAEEEFEAGNFTVSVLNMALIAASEVRDYAKMKHLAERFRCVEDYTVAELRALAADLTELNEDDIAYLAYLELYTKESGEKDIAFGFAIACERMGETDHTERILRELASSEGGIGPAARYLGQIGSKTHSFCYRFEGEEEKALRRAIRGKDFSSPEKLMEEACFLRSADTESIDRFLRDVPCEDPQAELELRRLSIDPAMHIVFRARAAQRLFQAGNKTVFFNTGTDIILFTPVITEVVERAVKGRKF